MSSKNSLTKHDCTYFFLSVLSFRLSSFPRYLSLSLSSQYDLESAYNRSLLTTFQLRISSIQFNSAFPLRDATSANGKARDFTDNAEGQVVIAFAP